ncbi:hypothetical protein [Micromonospora sp. NPDC048839]|uniref:hypothetical protein n=1 Tax=Micromonospora sp. NPDC048839 TaxID=3155641 RepID=UPI0033F0603B
MAQAGSRSAGAQSTPATAKTETIPVSQPEQSADAGRVAELEAEVEQLREQLAEAREPKTSEGGEPAYVAALVDALADGATVPENVERRLRAAGRLTNRPVEPSFGLSEGQRQELLATGKTTSPFTGTPQLGTGKPGEKPRAVSAAEHAKTPAKQQAPARDKQ